ncbi:PREDICTED: GDSL esterase/lipase LIP-4-like [Ipomoea nil]|uniref:GDSL esterase/lipase LIP-4-like n=1 Tax=Ipomoea nil TaxID=35883 RepID=UPI000900879B|nr:PREDICTED: GDSL esterase/lipase LIP-4-like [Ipomoea nil]
MELKLLCIITFTAILLVCSPPLAAGAECQKSPIIFNFGDSNSDTGGFGVAYGSLLGYPNGRKFFHRSSDRFSDGRLIIDFLCDNVKMDYLSSYLESLTSNFKNGVNFAVGGATAFPKSNFFSLKTQIKEFSRFHSRSLNFHLEGVKGMFDREDFGNALYMIDIGQNDITLAFYNHTKLEVVVQQIPFLISEIKDAIEYLYKAGGRMFWVHNTGPAGCLPQMLATKVGDFDEAGCLKPLNEAAREFNAQLLNLSANLRVELKNATVVYVDMYTIKYDLISNSALYGFEKPLMACCGGGGAPYNADPKILCGTTGYTVCDEDTRFISWDGIHYTDNANAVFAARIATTNYSTPPLRFDSFWC